ncbi:sacsin N-terminal ATP-binding-like domain-containing protein [Microvirga guangxiensis]|uniref:Sacsin/Nov domain-containing protein n=1 Tax=Microvirga guangxiensis TaxID=549386 RepID=A0A1G5F4I4_9HYPH|nr:hypothetical protein [Microvirga guangxiensis]SCY34159.1 hypothetical protein SAMN02927923_01216 [Microvirga guangxiensis]
MSTFLKTLMQQRRMFLDGLDANQGDINLDIFEDFYPDQAHFVFELLQNAEDTGATEAAFTLTNEGCWFEHNGTRGFTEGDVRAITGIHNSTKTKAPDQIGKFGVGFKSVFVYTLTPTIYSADFSFRISRLVMPEPVSHDLAIGTRTKFWLPFNNPNKELTAAFAEIKAGLNELAETTLLFLSNIESIKWRVGSETEGEILRIGHSEFHIEVLKQINGETTTSAHFLKFNEPVSGLERQNVAIAYALDFLPNVQSFSRSKQLSQQLRIVPTRGQVAVFFPAGKETSGLRFHLHAPFVPELSRASIKKTPANNPLFQQLASLTASSLHTIRDQGLLTTDFLGVLPNPQDQLGDSYVCIREAVVEAMNTRPLTPTHAKRHAPARYLVQAKSSLKDLLSLEDIEYLIDYDDEPPQWAASRALQGTNVERFMNGLAIEDWDIEQFVDCVVDKSSEGKWGGVEDDFITWIGSKNAEWHQQFYALLTRESEAQDELYRLKRCKIVRLSDGRYSVATKCHFPDERGLKSSNVLCVDQAVYTAGKSKAQQESARKFLEEAGVTSIGERQLVEAILRSSYTDDKRTLNQREYLSHMRRFIKLLDEDPSSASLLSSYPLLMGKDNKWHKPSEIYLDAPYLDTGLGEYLAIAGGAPQLHPLADFYQALPIDTPKVVRFAETLGCLTQISLTKVNCSRNPQWPYLSSVSGKLFTSPIDRDFLIKNFQQLVERKSEKLARLVWNTMCSLTGTNYMYDSPYNQNPLRAVYQKNSTGGARFADSQLIHQLRNYPWVPQRGGGFVRPAQARAELLPDGFTFDPGWRWIKAVEFGKSIQLQNEKAVAEAAAAAESQRRQQEAAKALGFDDPETARKLAAIPAEELNRFYADWIRRKDIELPDREPKNPARRAEAVATQAADAPERISEQRTRSVSVGREAVKEDAAQYLLQQYTTDGDVICQVCKRPMPFKRDDGSWYFEKVEFIPELRKRYYQNYLALCPNHAAMFKEANGSSEFMRDMFVELSGSELEVVLAQQDETIYFTKTHIADLKQVIAVDEASAAPELELVHSSDVG